MRTQRILGLVVIGCLVAGCGDSSKIRAKGRIVKGGQPYLTGEGQGLRVFLVPLTLKDEVHFDSFAAEYNPEDGTFQVRGKDGKGLPAGKYRVDLQLMKSKEDLLGGQLLGKKSPFVLEVTGSSNDLVINLDEAKFDSILANPKPAKTAPAKSAKKRNLAGS